MRALRLLFWKCRYLWLCLRHGWLEWRLDRLAARSLRLQTRRTRVEWRLGEALEHLDTLEK